MNLCIFEDEHAADMHPLTYTRPVFAHRCGVLTLLEKSTHAIPADAVTLIVRQHLEDYTKELYPDFQVNTPPDADTLFLNGRVLPDKKFTLPDHSANDRPKLYSRDGEILAAFVPAGHLPELNGGSPDFGSLTDTAETESVEWTTVRYPWDLTRLNAQEIRNDIDRLNRSAGIEISNYPGVHVDDPSGIFLGKAVDIQPGVVMDTSDGPIMLDDDVIVHPNAVIAGPAYVGPHSKISAGANITGNCSFGPVCKVGGEVTNTVIQGYSNKKHDGFLGGAYIGEWVNFGAATNNSDLKNNYSTVQVAINGKPVETGERFVGCIVGDHSKFGIGSTLNTGSVVGLGCNLYGSGFPPKYIPAFSWGGADQLTEYRLDKMLETARIVMDRRDVELTTAYESMLRYIFKQTAKERDAVHD